MPPWVRHQFPEAGEFVRKLRDTSCTDSSCKWCRTWSNPAALLERWFGFEGFRPKPAAEDGRSLQETIVASALAKSSVLGILPTGTGKSLCYQLPALSQYHRTGALTVVISPLVALMADQVRSLERHQISSCVTINGLLSLPERHNAFERVRLGEASILLISPEQLRSPSVRSVLEQREVGYWVIDEAHCVSKWGHDFRPDYRYIARFIREYSRDSKPAPLICLTATAKPGVIDDICDHFRGKTGRQPQADRRRCAPRQSLVRRHRDRQGRQAWRHPVDPRRRITPRRYVRRDRLLRDPPRDREGGGLFEGKGLLRRPLPRRPDAGCQEGDTRAVRERWSPRHRRHQRLRHGYRQARHPPCRSRGHPGFARKLRPGGRARRS